MKLPTTRQGCIEKYNLRRQMYIPLTKFDMYLGGMICCSKKEFLYRKPEGEDELIGGNWPCLCVSETICNADGYINCFRAMDKTLHLPWDAPLYEMEEGRC